MPGGWAGSEACTHLGLACHRRVVVQLQQPFQPISVERDCVPAPEFDFGLAYDDGNPSSTVKPAEEAKERFSDQPAHCVFRPQGHHLRVMASLRANLFRIRLTNIKGSLNVSVEELEACSLG